MKYNLLWCCSVLKVLNKLCMYFMELHKIICAVVVAVEAKLAMSFWKTQSIALWPCRGDVAFLQGPGVAIIIALVFHRPSAFLHVQNRSDMGPTCIGVPRIN